MIQVNGHDRATKFVSPPPGVEWPPATGPAAQTGVDVEDEDVNWAALGVEEEAAARAAGKRPAASKKLKKRSVTFLRTGGALHINEPEKDSGRNPASKCRETMFSWPDEDAEEEEDTDVFQLIPRKRRKEQQSVEQGGSSAPAGPAGPAMMGDATAPVSPSAPLSPTIPQSGDGGTSHQVPAPELGAKERQGPSAHRVERERPRRRAFATSFRASNM